MTVRPVLEPECLRELSRVSNVASIRDLLLVWGGIFAAAAVTHAVGHWFAYLLAMIFIGSRQNALATLAHEAWHRLAFSPGNLNHKLGAWLMAYPVGIPYYHDRRRHLCHHREVGGPGDPDWINYSNDGKDTPSRVVIYLVSLLCGRLFLSTALSVMLRRRPRVALDEIQPAGDPSVAVEFGRVILCQIVLLLGFWTLGGWWAYPLLWFGPLATFAGFFANTRALVEHASVKNRVPAEARLRDFAVGPLEALLLSPNHFHYHALHHEFVSIPHRNLPAAKRAVIDAYGSYPFEVAPGYLRALARHLRELDRQRGPTHA